MHTGRRAEIDIVICAFWNIKGRNESETFAPFKNRELTHFIFLYRSDCCWEISDGRIVVVHLPEGWATPSIHAPFYVNKRGYSMRGALPRTRWAPQPPRHGSHASCRVSSTPLYTPLWRGVWRGGAHPDGHDETTGAEKPRQSLGRLEPPNGVNGASKRGEWRLQTTWMEAPNTLNGASKHPEIHVMLVNVGQCWSMGFQNVVPLHRRRKSPVSGPSALSHS